MKLLNQPGKTSPEESTNKNYLNRTSMSFAGHVADMMRRYKENRELRTIHQERRRDKQKKSFKTNPLPDVTVEQLEHNMQKTKERAQQESSYFSKMLIISLLIGIIIILLLLWIIV